MATYLQLITPVNIADEKQKFLRSTSYSPQFTYQWDELLLDEIRSGRPELVPLADVLQRQDIAAMQQFAERYFDVQYRPADLALARQLVQQTPPESNATAEQVAKLMAATLREFGIQYDVEIVDRHGFQCRPDHKDKIIRISKYLHVQFYPARSVVTHELVHIIRAVNGAANRIVAKPGFLPTEEGLACLVQDNLFRAEAPSAFQHALEYLASHVALQAGFRDVYQFFLDHGCNSETAWLRSIRQKFGLIDTGQPGSLMKSGMYFYHEQLLRELPPEQLVRLFVGKIPQSELAAYPTYTGDIAEQKIRALLLPQS